MRYHGPVVILTDYCGSKKRRWVIINRLSFADETLAVTETAHLSHWLSHRTRLRPSTC